ncbi:MAG: 3-deoxy-D-manno-octulosonic acid transferase, partial [Thermodesulfovibrionales bacterium]
MIEKLFYLFYTLLYTIVLLFFLPFEYLKRSLDLRKTWLRERLGFLPTDSITGFSGYKVIWIHAVSVGETISSVPFVQEILKRFPSVRVILTTVTDTGQKVARERLSGNALIFYLPFDLPFSIKRFIMAIRPSLYISVETEIWPNLFRLLKKEGIPVLIMNGRISDDSFKGYRKIRFFMKRIFDAVDLFCMQEALYGERIKTLGAPAERIRVTGNFKFDIRIDEYRHDWVRQLHRPVILAGSTHEGEEDMILRACERLKKDIGDMTLIIAPRHPERFGEVEEIIKRNGFRYTKRSRIDDRDIATLRDTGVIL